LWYQHRYPLYRNGIYETQELHPPSNPCVGCVLKPTKSKDGSYLQKLKVLYTRFRNHRIVFINNIKQSKQVSINELTRRIEKSAVSTRILNSLETISAPVGKSFKLFHISIVGYVLPKTTRFLETIHLCCFLIAVMNYSHCPAINYKIIIGLRSKSFN
jgi:hypothetical protein